jgi:hypothetical protein
MQVQHSWRSESKRSMGSDIGTENALLLTRSDLP